MKRKMEEIVYSYKHVTAERIQQLLLPQLWLDVEEWKNVSLSLCADFHTRRKDPSFVLPNCSKWVISERPPCFWPVTAIKMKEYKDKCEDKEAGAASHKEAGTPNKDVSDKKLCARKDKDKDKGTKGLQVNDNKALEILISECIEENDMVKTPAGRGESAEYSRVTDYPNPLWGWFAMVQWFVTMFNRKRFRYSTFLSSAAATRFRFSIK
jgi:hypothetical protein